MVMSRGVFPMNMIDKTFDVHERALAFRSQRMEILAQNIANADTPHFKARDLDFRQLLQGAQDSNVQLTNAGHTNQTPEDTRSGLKYRVPYNTSFDGNTVELPVEQAKYGQYAADYQTTLSILEARIGGIRKALRGE
jgi:flagellar basal-body rod protein FlgB